MDRPLLLLSWVHELMLQRQTAGGLRMPAPILARVYTVRGLTAGLFCLLEQFAWCMVHELMLQRQTAGRGGGQCCACLHLSWHACIW
jgi:hypothetical protein